MRRAACFLLLFPNVVNGGIEIGRVERRRFSQSGKVADLGKIAYDAIHVGLACCFRFSNLFDRLTGKPSITDSLIAGFLRILINARQPIPDRPFAHRQDFRQLLFLLVSLALSGSSLSAVEAALRHQKSEKMSDRQIAEHVGVSQWMITEYRKSICKTLSDAPAIREVTRNGKTYEMNRALCSHFSQDARSGIPMNAEPSEGGNVRQRGGDCSLRIVRSQPVTDNGYQSAVTVNR